MNSSSSFLSTSTASTLVPFVFVPPSSTPQPLGNPDLDCDSGRSEHQATLGYPHQGIQVRERCVPQFAKVLHVINGEHFSGAERVQQLLGRALQQFGVRAEFACVKPGRFPELCGLDANQVSLHPMKNRLDMRVVQQLVNKVRTEKFDMLHAHTPRSALVAALVAARTGLPWCYHVHSPTSRDSTRGIVNHINLWMERFSIRTCTKLLTVSNSLLEEMLRLGVPRKQLALVPNGVPPIDPIDADARRTDPTWRLGIIALMRPRKGVEIALEALCQLRTQQVNVDLELIGGFETESYQAEILGAIERLGLQGSVHWTGFTSDIRAALHRLDALLLPSLFGEGMPMVVLEALAAAVPVIATRVEGTPEVVRDGIEGLLAEPRSVESLASKIYELTSNRNRWTQLSRAALLRHRLHFTDSEMASRVAEVYREIAMVSSAKIRAESGIPFLLQTPTPTPTMVSTHGQ